MEINKEIAINKSVSEVWNLIGNRFSDAHLWARGLTHSEGFGSAGKDGAPCQNRVCDVPGFGIIKEKIEKFDAKNQILSYSVIEGFPSFISSAVNTWTLKRLSEDKTLVSMKLSMKTRGFKGLIMGPLMKMQISKLTAGVVNDLKVYLETGSPSPVKRKEIEKNNRAIAHL